MTFLSEFSWLRAIPIAIAYALLLGHVSWIIEVLAGTGGSGYVSTWAIYSEDITRAVFICLLSVAYFWDKPAGFLPGAVIAFLCMVAEESGLSSTYFDFDGNLVRATITAIVVVGTFGWVLGIAKDRVKVALD